MLLNYINWNIDPEMLNIFGISIRYYGLLFAFGIVLANYTLNYLFQEEKISEENQKKLFSYIMVGIILGARLGHCLFYEPSYYLSHPLEMILPITFPEAGGIKFIGYQGLASHGGIIGLITAMYLYARKTKTSVLKTMDLIGVVSGVAFGCIRLGNFMNSEIIGYPTKKAWGVIFERIDNIPRHPAQLYESICYFIIFAILLLLYKTQKDKVKHGFFFGVGCILFFSARIFIEFLKENQVGFEEGMTLNMGQLLSLPFIAFGIGLIINGLRKNDASKLVVEKE